jgi:hypothetical protein
MKEQKGKNDLAKKKYLAYREFFTSEQGEEILTDLMRAAHFHTITIGKDPYETYFNEGRRSLLLQIFQTAKLDNKQIDNLTKKIQEEDQYFL